MEAHLDATPRAPQQRKNDARKVRAQGGLPGVVYGRSREALPVSVDPFTFTSIFRKSQNRNTVVRLQFEGQDIPCLVKTVQRHPVSRDILHVDFYALDEAQEVVVDVPLHTEGRPAGAVLGGKLRLIRREVPIRCRYDRIPAQITVDVRPLQIGDIIRVSELPRPEGTEVVYEQDYNCITLYGKRSISLDLPPAPGEGEEEGEGAEGEGAEAASEGTESE